MRFPSDLRLFIAINLPRGVRASLYRSGELLALTGADVKWVEMENLHLTLRFIGGVDPSLLPALRDALAEVGTVHRRFAMRLSSPGTFPARGVPRVIWAGCTGDLAVLCALQRDVEARVVATGLPPETRPFSPHVTLGRVRSDCNVRALKDRLSAMRETDFGSMEIGAVSLMESRLSSQGPVYQSLFEAPLTFQPVS